jgi:hypothetical protein
MQAMAFHRLTHELPLGQRQQIYRAVEEALLPWLQGREPEVPTLTLRLQALEGLMSDGHQMAKECTLTLAVQAPAM